MAQMYRRRSVVFEVGNASDEHDSNEASPLLTRVSKTKPMRVVRSYRTQYSGPLCPGHAEGIPVEITNDEHTISTQFESQDYDTCENSLLLDQMRVDGYSSVRNDNIARWCIMALIGILTALVGCFIVICSEQLSELKYSFLKTKIKECIFEKKCIAVVPYLWWVLTNIIPVFFAAVLASIVEPVAAGSGIPQVKCYLNGVKIPRIVRFRTLVAKSVGVILSVAGGLAVGKEGPMIHSGAVIAAGVSQGKITSIGKDFKIFQSFRSDREKRDFVSGGAAAGVASAFGAPVGGVLFSLEEGASFWNQSLTWRIFFCSMITTFMLNMVLSTYYHHYLQLDYSGLLNFGSFDDLDYQIFEIPIYALMGAFGGLFGAIFNYINYKLTLFRIRHVYNPFVKVAEALIVAAITATAGFLMIYLAYSDCKPLGQDPTDYPVQFRCDDGEYNAVAALWFQIPEKSVQSLFHDPPGSHKAGSIGAFFVVYFLLSCWTYGLGVPSGLFIPALLTGAAWGRLIGMMIEENSNDDWASNPGKYALIGAAAQLGGVVRMTLSLSVILIEATGNITFGLPIMIVLISAKFVGDYFNEGIYDMHIQLNNVPILDWEPPPLSQTIYASEIMSHPVTTLNMVENVGTIVNILRKESSNGFPIVDVSPVEDGSGRTFGRCKGLILRSQLITLLQHKVFNEGENPWENKPLSLHDFQANYPNFPPIEEIEITEMEMGHTIDLRPVMNPAPYSVLSCTSLPRIYHLFRGLGLRHLIVINENNEVVGIITRKDLARYHIETRGRRPILEELQISSG